MGKAMTVPSYFVLLFFARVGSIFCESIHEHRYDQ